MQNTSLEDVSAFVVYARVSLGTESKEHCKYDELIWQAIVVCAIYLAQ